MGWMIRIVLLASLIVPFQAFSQLGGGKSATLQERIAKELRPMGDKVSLSLRDSQGNEVFAHRGDTLMAPASIAKVVTTACSLESLGTSFEFLTTFGSRGQIVGDVLQGDLVIQGSGDPSLVIEDLREIVEKIRFVHGLKTIRGKLIIDTTYFGKKFLSIADGFDGDDGRSFAADLTPLSFNQNSFSFWVTSDVRNSDKVRIETLPAKLIKMQINSTVKVGSSTSLAVDYDPKTSKAVISGSVEKGAEPRGIYRAVTDPYQYAFDLFRRLWIDSGGEWPEASWEAATDTKITARLWVHKSRVLSRILMDVNKLSLNLAAEMSYLAAGAIKFGLPATFEKSSQLLSECLTKKKLDLKGFDLKNGSGLSRESRLMTSALTSFLGSMQKSVYSPEYLASFSIIGVDGTMRTRLQDFSGRGRIKTGSLRDVRSIAGYLTSKQGEIYSVALIQNGVASGSARELEDKILRIIFEQI
jgi:D-alanyl-D-alanine carboxypeptidase/D-alanyl-D-alanine-endopeptidase (penicillin-binding protein 4)